MKFVLDKLFDGLAIRDANAHASGERDLAAGGFEAGLLILESTLDQAVGVQVQGRATASGSWHDVGSPASVPAYVSGDPQKGTVEVSAPWPQVRAVATAGGVPVAGTLTGWLSKRG